MTRTVTTVDRAGAEPDHPIGAAVLVRRLLDLLGTKSLDRLPEILAEQFTIDEPAALPWGGRHRGPDGYARLLARMNGAADIDLTVRDLRAVPDSPDADRSARLAVLQMDVTYRGRTTGRAVTVPVVEVFTSTTDRLISSTVHIGDLPALLSVLAPAPAPKLDERVLGWLSRRHQAVLATTRADGTPQTSNVVYAVRNGQVLISVTADRAKTRNLRRHPAAVLHVPGDTFGQYAAVTCSASLGEASLRPGDATGQQLLAVYEAIRGRPHPDPDEFHRAMVDERRLLITLTPLTATSWGIPNAA